MWLLMICGVLAVGFIFFVASALSYFLTRHRSKIATRIDELAYLQEEVAILRKEVEQLREEVEQARKGRGAVSSPHIKEG